MKIRQAIKVLDKWWRSGGQGRYPTTSKADWRFRKYRNGCPVITDPEMAMSAMRKQTKIL